MMTGMLHLHITAAFLSFFLLVAKSVLLWANKLETLEKVRAKTKIAEMIIGSLLLVTGIVMLTQTTPSAYHYTKLLIVFLSMPLGIIAFRKQNKVLPVIILLMLIYAFRIANVKTLNPMGIELKTPEKTEVAIPDSTKQTANDILNQNKEALLVKGQELFAVACTPCHGADGKLGVSGAKDLTQSDKSHEEKVNIIRYGKGLMTPFGTQFSEEEIEALAYYVDSMRK